MTERFEPEKLPFAERFRVCWDFESQIKFIWLTGWLLITWEFDGFGDTVWNTLDFGWYKGGSYG